MTISIFNPFGKLEQRSTYLGSSGYTPSFLVQNGTIVPQNFVSADEALKNVDVFSMINLISSDIASCEFQNANQYSQLLKQPSKIINGYSFWQSAIVQLLLTGNSYLWMHTDQGKLAQLEQIPTSQVQVELADYSSNIQYTLNFDDGRPIAVVDNSEMIHLRLMPTGEITAGYQFMGVSPLNSLGSSIQIANNANRLTLSTLVNAINPSTIIKVPDAKLGSKAKNAIRDSFVDQNTGDNAGKPTVLDQSADLSVLQINADVAKFISSIDWGAERVAEAFGIPASYLNHDKADAQSNAQEIVAFYISSLNRYIKPLISELSFKLGLPDLKLNIMDSTDITGSQTVDMISKLAATSVGVLTPEMGQNILSRKGIVIKDDLSTNENQTN